MKSTAAAWPPGGKKALCLPERSSAMASRSPKTPKQEKSDRTPRACSSPSHASFLSRHLSPKRKGTKKQFCHQRDCWTWPPTSSEIEDRARVTALVPGRPRPCRRRPSAPVSAPARQSPGRRPRTCSDMSATAGISICATHWPRPTYA